MGLEPGSYQVTARQAAFAQDHLDIEPTDHFEGNRPVRHRVRPEPRWPGTLSQSGILWADQEDEGLPGLSSLGQTCGDWGST